MVGVANLPKIAGKSRVHNASQETTAEKSETCQTEETAEPDWKEDESINTRTVNAVKNMIHSRNMESKQRVRTLW